MFYSLFSPPPPFPHILRTSNIPEIPLVNRYNSKRQQGLVPVLEKALQPMFFILAAPLSVRTDVAGLCSLLCIFSGTALEPPIKSAATAMAHVSCYYLHFWIGHPSLYCLSWLLLNFSVRMITGASSIDMGRWLLFTFESSKNIVSPLTSRCCFSKKWRHPFSCFVLWEPIFGCEF